MPEIDEELASEYALNFLGYGALDKEAVWLIGPEAGGDSSLSKLHKRLTTWNQLKRRRLEDLQKYHELLDLPPNENWAKNIQPTWGPLIRVLMALEGTRYASTDEVRQYQIDKLGRLGGTNAILDLSQVSAKSLGSWQAHSTGIAWLASREAYEAEVLPQRCQLIRDALESIKPRLVIFYGLGHRGWWSKIATRPLIQSKMDKLDLANDGVTQFALMRHPSDKTSRGKGAKIAYFSQVGELLRSL